MDRRILKILEVLEAEWNRPLSVRRLAIGVSLSPRRLRQLFGKEVGISITQYIRQKRLRTAAELLINTHMRISEICYRVGYDNPRSFARLFKHFCGDTPSDYRLNKANESENNNSMSWPLI